MEWVSVYWYPEDGSEALAGGFDRDKAKFFGEDYDVDHSGNYISKATGQQCEHEELILTDGGRWVKHSWSRWQGSPPASYEFITDDEARTWLTAQNKHKTLQKYFGREPEESGPPVTGRRIESGSQPSVQVLVDAMVLAISQSPGRLEKMTEAWNDPVHAHLGEAEAAIRDLITGDKAAMKVFTEYLLGQVNWWLVVNQMCD